MYRADQGMLYRLLGPLETRVDGEALPLGGGKQRAVLATLLLSPNRVVPIDRLVDGLWGAEPPETAVKAVQIYVSRLRKVLPQGRLETRPPGYLISVEPGELDLERFEELLSSGRAELATGRAEEAGRTLREALELWRGDALAEFEEPFAAIEAARLEELRLACLEERIEADLALGHHAQLVGELEAFVSRHPLRERIRRQQLLALYRSGRQAEALAAYSEFRRRLDEELGIEPSQQLRELERRILQQDPGLAPTGRTTPPAVADRVSLSPLVRVASPQAVVGRERDLAHLRRLFGEAMGAMRRIVFVTGEAGIGKTTLAEAFLVEAAASPEVLFARGQCIEHRGAGEPYLPFLEALGRLGGQVPDGGLVELLSRRAPTWLAQLPALVDPDKLAALQPRLVGTTHERMLREMVEALDELTGTRPLVLVLEDLHWTDYSTVDLIGALARRREPARLLVIGTLRPPSRLDAGHPLHGIVQSLRIRGLATELGLGGIGEDGVREYLEQRFPEGELPRELASLLSELTGGSPLFVETVRRLDRRGRAPAGRERLAARGRPGGDRGLGPGKPPAVDRAPRARARAGRSGVAAGRERGGPGVRDRCRRGRLGPGRGGRGRAVPGPRECAGLHRAAWGGGVA